MGFARVTGTPLRFTGANIRSVTAYRAVGRLKAKTVSTVLALDVRAAPPHAGGDANQSVRLGYLKCTFQGSNLEPSVP